jgi:hypothetical protein
MFAWNSRLIDRLKVLPLTILITVLLWLYADAHLTETQSDLPIQIYLVAAPGANNRIVQEISPTDGRFQVTIQGPSDAVERIRLQCYGGSIFTRDDQNNLTYVIPQSDSQRVGATTGFDALDVLNSLAYFSDRNVIVTAVHPQQIQLRVDQIISVQRPIEFTALHGVQAALSSTVAQVQLPSSVLQSLGGPDQLQVIAQPLVDPGSLPPNTRQTIDARLVVQYPGVVSSQISVIPDSVQVTFTIPSQKREKLFVGIVPVWVSGPSWLLERYDVAVNPTNLQVDVSGSPQLLELLRNSLIMGDSTPLSQRVIAFLDITSSEVSNTDWTLYNIRYSLPDGITILDGPRTVLCRITRREQPPSAATPAGLATQPTQ